MSAVTAAVDFAGFRHPVMAVACPDCRKQQGAYCIRPSGHRAADFHSARKAEADRVFIAQHGERATIERLPGEKWRLDPGGYSTELTPDGEQSVIPGCERNLSPKATQLDLF